MEAGFNPSVPQHSKQPLLYPYTEVSVCRSTFPRSCSNRSVTFAAYRLEQRERVYVSYGAASTFSVLSCRNRQTDRPLNCLHLHPRGSTAYYRKDLENPTTEGCTTKTVNKWRNLEQHNGLEKKMHLWIITKIYLENNGNVILRVF